MNTGKPRIFSIFLFTVCIGFLFSSCDNENSFIIGEGFIKSPARMAIVDTCTVEMSTVVQDSVPTSGTGAMLIGNYEDTLYGDAGCSSLFQLGLPYYVNLYDDDYYDSISLIIHYSGYSYGDTNNLLQINVHRLTEDIELRATGSIYNTTAFAYEDDPLGTVQIRPRPGSTDSIEIKISDAFGQELFGKFVERSEDILSEYEFLAYFKGLALIPDASSKNAIIGFKVTPDYLKLRLYTHRIDQTSYATAYDFPLVYPEKQFNHITYDFSNTVLDYAQVEGKPIPSSVAGNRAFVQGYKKIMTKVRFPTMPDLLLNDKGIIMKAELIFEPVKSSYVDFSLPNFVILYRTNRLNLPFSLLYNADNTVNQATLVVDHQYHEETSYTFDISAYFTEEMEGGYFDINHGLLISLYDENYQLNFERIMIETKNPAPKLKLYYLIYQ
jgi:hypothetical protein